MIKKLLPLALFVYLPACKEVKKEEEHLPKEKMQAILLDINIAESYSTMVADSLHKAGTKNSDSLAAFYKAIFTHHNITQEAYERSLAWYKANPSEMDSLFSSLIPTVAALQDTIKKK